MANTTKKITVRFTIDFIEQTITGTKASYHKASKGCGPEYEELAAKTAAHPEFELVVKEQKKHSMVVCYSCIRDATRCLRDDKRFVDRF